MSQRKYKNVTTQIKIYNASKNITAATQVLGVLQLNASRSM